MLRMLKVGGTETFVSEDDSCGMCRMKPSVQCVSRDEGNLKMTPKWEVHVHKQSAAMV